MNCNVLVMLTEYEKDLCKTVSKMCDSNTVLEIIFILKSTGHVFFQIVILVKHLINLSGH